MAGLPGDQVHYPRSPTLCPACSLTVVAKITGGHMCHDTMLL
jgi:hypothetical protein